ncbi:MAG: aspartate aminotransferase family protein [Candidatus Hodarchaeota archaeon]
MKNVLENYRKSTPKSEKLFERALKVFAGGVNHNLRTFAMDWCGAYPPYMVRGDGGHIWDVDGNDYIDWWMTHYAQILGHNNPSVKTAIEGQLDAGIHLGALNQYMVDFGERIQEAIPDLARMRFCSTGSEATMYAVRLARVFTKKQKIAKTFGGWHGGNDSLEFHLSHPFEDEPHFNGVSFDFNDRESFDHMLKEHGRDLAAVVIEPMLGAGGGLAPEPEFLPYLREETERRGILLIFDEIITGFRLRYGAAGKEVFGVQPDLLTLGKIAGGGMHLGVYGGREDVMALAAPKAPGGRWVGGGTFSSHPLAMVAGLATLEQLQSYRDKYEKLNKSGDEFRDKLNILFDEERALAVATGVGSMMFITILLHELTDLPLTGRKLSETVDHKNLDKFQGLLMERGLFGYHGLGCISFSHTKEDLQKSFDIITEVIHLLKSSS